MVVAFLFVKISSYVTDILVEGEIVKKEEHGVSEGVPFFRGTCRRNQLSLH